MLAFSALSFASPRDFEIDPAAPLASALSPIAGMVMRQDELTAMAQPFAHATSYRLFLPDAASADATDDDAWTDREDHTVTVLRADPHDRAGDRLFIDHVEIDRRQWRWSADNTTLRWCHGQGDEHLGGELAFDGLGYRAAGAVAFGARSTKAFAVAAAARFDCRLMHDGTAAYKVSDTALTWTKNAAWSDAGRWSSPALRWSFWVEEYVDDYGNRSYRPRIRFEDMQTGVIFEPGVGAFIASIDAERHYHFELASGYRGSPDNDRSGLSVDRDRAIKSVFPIRMRIRLDATAQRVEGAIEVQGPGDTTLVYALSGEAHDPARVAALSAAKPARALDAAAPSEAELSPYYLYNLDPYDFVEVGSDKVIRDAVQAEVEKSLARIIQHYMPDEMRRKFVSPTPIDLDAEVRAIARSKASSGEQPKDLYESLARPFLSMALPSPKLNARRARKLLDERLSESPVYREHAVKLYAHHFRQKFPGFKSYLEDEGLNVEEKRRQLEAYTAKKVATYRALREDAESDAVREQCDLMIGELEAAKQRGLAGRYWAHRVYTHFTSDEFVGMLQMQMFASAEGAKAAARNVQRVSTILSVLDDSQHFAERFAEFMNIFRLFALITQHANLSQDQKVLRDVVDDITAQFAEQHAGSTDATTRALAEYMKTAKQDKASGQANLWAKILEIGYEMLASAEKVQSLAKALALLMSKLDEKLANLKTYIVEKLPALVTKLGGHGLTIGKAVVKFIGLGLGAVMAGGAVVVLAMQWNDLNDVTKAGLITMGVGLLANTAVTFVKGTAKLGANLFGVASEHGYRAALKWFFGRAGDQTKVLAEAAQGGAQKLLERLLGGSRQIATAPALAAETAAKAAKILRLLTGITRLVMIAFSAVISIVSIVLTAIELSKAKTPLEKTMHALMLAAGGLELIGLGFAAGSAVASAMAAGTAATVLTVISGVFMGLALVVALIAIGIMIYLAVTTKPEDPPEEFARLEAVKDELYMPRETAIDYLLPLHDESGRLVKDGVTILTVAQPGEPALHLTIASDGTVGAGPWRDDLTTGFGLTVDGQGRALVFAATIPESGKVVPRYLTVGDDGSLRAEDKLLDGADRARQLWIADLVGEPGDVGKEGNNLVRGRFQLHVMMAKKKLYLCFKGGRFGVDDNPQDLRLALQSTRPADLRVEDISLTTRDRDQIFYACLGIAGSGPRSWSLRGLLPDFLDFDDKVGALKQREGMTPSVSTSGPLHVIVKAGEFELLSNPFAVTVVPS